ncbi:hypothetical protein F4821DRAFT_254873 [Hypoxylon rubiginosum]|uniref:Uncharacterized protein n=1 Tax=Hypoxylon rubiginosum TaxID=110542 RepID=A0ACC0DG59_9PEZI|nr:hypothetical protein F4821DRAFT_254873 [Hypoxylon rubiginosum]
MAPNLNPLRRDKFDPSMASDEFREQWINPGDVFSILLILGGDVVQLALAQLAGSGFAPVAFSFGWVAYSISALVASLGSNKLMPRNPDCKCKVINGKTGYIRENSSWVLGRVLRDFRYWMHPETQALLQRNVDGLWAKMKKKNPNAKKPGKAGLIVTLYEPSLDVPLGKPKRDWLYWSGIMVIIIQLGVAVIPLGLFGDWGILLVTVVGTILAIATGLLPQWEEEKWACRTETHTPYVLTEGNGSQHAIVVLGNGRGFNLEDLATGQTNATGDRNNTSWVVLSILSAFWILLLITATAIQENTWYLLAIGGLGIVQNVTAAGWIRRPEALGFPLEFVGVCGETSVMGTLIELEKQYPSLGRSMRDEFFPGKLKPEELVVWDELERKALEKLSNK